MGRQIQLHGANSDLDVLMNAVIRIEQVAILRDEWKQPEPEELVDLRMRSIEDNKHWVVYLCRRPDIGSLTVRGMSPLDRGRTGEVVLGAASR
ncbi:MAG TPA: hypothetical protein VLS89_11460 [Candidatus Nanopelagicales bacterium]|nr:hypothetical protein [Candidatus Nanopelagicales bacterium]